jgi:hypothetical protein
VKNETRDKAARGTRKGLMFRRRQLTCQEGINGTRNRDFKEQLHLGSERTSSGIYTKTSGLDITKRTAGSSVRLQRMGDWTLWRGSTTSKMEKVIAHRVGVGNVGALVTLGIFAPTDWKKKKDDGRRESSWRQVTAVKKKKTKPQEDENKHTPQEKWRYACRLFFPNGLKEGAM